MLLQRSPQNQGNELVANIRDYGAGVGDPVADTAAFAKLAVAGATIYLPKGTYVPTSIVIPQGGNLRISGAGDDSVLMPSNAVAGGKPITGGGTNVGGTIALAADAAEFTDTVTLIAGGGASFAVGNYLYLSNGGGTLTQMNQVVGVAGDVLTLADPLYETFAVADGATVTKMTLAPGVEFDHLAFDFSNVTGANSFAIYLDTCLAPRVTSCTFRNMIDGGALYFHRCYGGQAADLFLDQCGNGAISSITAANSTGVELQDIDNQRGGFGPEVHYSNGCHLDNIRSVYTNGRAVKLQGASHNSGANINASHSWSETGFSTTNGSHHNSFHGIQAIDNHTSEGIWFSGQANHHNVYEGVVSRGNGLFDVAFNATDTNNYVDGDFDKTKVRNLGDATNHSFCKTELPTVDPHVLGMFWANAGVLTVSAG